MKASLSLAFEIPQDEAADFARLPAKSRDRVRWLLSVMRAVSSSKGKVQACKDIAAAAGLHFNSIYQPWQRYSQSGDWRTLLDRRRTPEFWKRDSSKTIGLPAPFVTEWKTRVESNDRAAKPAYARLIRDWQLWRNGDLTIAIPGYDRCPPPAAGSRVPRGWTYSNLLQHMPNEVELAAARKGRTAAKKLLPGVITTRVGTYPFAEIQFDDMWHSFLVNVPGYQKAYRLLEFGAIDNFSTYIFKPGLKPRLPDMDTGKMKQLNGRDFHLYLVNWLLDYGVHPDGTVFNVENGTAAISRTMEEKLLMWFGGRLTVSRSGMSGAPAFPGSWKERAKGNPNAKALKEGIGKLIQNALGHLPGQVGMNRDDAPASLKGREDENELLLAIASVVPALRDKLSLGFLDLQEAVFAVQDTYDLLNCRTDHQMEGWEECGLVIEEFRPSKLIDQWLPLHQTLENASEADRIGLGIALRCDPSILRRRKLSPAESLLANTPRLIKPPLESIPDLLGPEHGHIKQVVGGLFGFTIPGLGKLRYKSTYQDEHGFLRRLDNGTEVLAHLNPWKPDHIYLSDARTHRFLGIAKRHQAVTRGDVDAIHRMHGEAERDFKDSVAETAARHGLSRIPHIKANTRILRQANQPSARDTALAAANLDPSSMLDADDSDLAYNAPDPAIAFDPADLL
jgi:hypothetical protein